MHRMRCLFAKAGMTLVLAAVFGPAPAARANLIRPDAAQSFPDLAGDIVGSQSFSYDPNQKSGLFQVNSAPSVLALGPKASSEYYVYDPPGQSRSQTIQVKLDTNGQLITDSGNSYSLYGSVTVDGKIYSGLLLQGTPTQFGYATPSPQFPTMSVYDMNMNITGGLLKEAYGPDAYVRIIAEANSTFGGTFDKNFLGLKAMTNVRAYNSPNPSPLPEPSTFAVLLAFSGAGLLYHHRRRIAVADLTAAG